MRYWISLNKVPNQEGSFNITTNSGEILACDFKLRTLTDNSLIIDLTVNDKVIFQSRKCINKMPLIYNNGFGGNFYWEDLYGNDNPSYNDFNDRFIFIFDTEYRI